jgi:hypothetical protein
MTRQPVLAEAGRFVWIRRLALLASVATNVVLVLLPRAAKDRPTTPPGATATTVRPLLLPLDPSQASASASSCEADVRSLEARHAELLRAIEANRPFRERFATGAPDPTTTAEMAGIVERAVGRPDGGPGLQVECRANVCRVAAPPEYRSHGDWERTLRRSTEFASRVGEESTAGGFDMIFPLRDRPSGESKAVLVTLLKDFRAGTAGSDCWAQHKHQGRLDLALWIGDRDPADDDPPTAPESLPNGLHLSVQGPLAGTPAGRCLLDRLRELALRAPVPKHETPAMQMAVLWLPPRGR